MKRLKSMVYWVAVILASVLTRCWQALLWLIDCIDGGDEMESAATDRLIRYNYRTGDIDPLKRPDGLYENEV